MNSVFSAFKSSKSDGSIQSNKGKKGGGGGPVNSSSYANLRHIREIGSSAKMSSFVGHNDDDDDIAPNLRLTKCTTLHSSSGVATTASTPSSPSTSSTSSLSMEQIIPQSTATPPTTTTTIKTNTTAHQTDCDSNTNSSINTRSVHSESSQNVNIDKGIVSTATDTPPVIAYEQQHASSAIPINSQSVASYMQSNIPSNGTQVTDCVADHSLRDGENKENTDTTNPSTITSDLACLSDSPAFVSNGTDISDKHHVHSIDTNAVQMINGGIGSSNHNSNNTTTNTEKHTPILSAASNKKLNNRLNESTVPNTASAKSTSCNRFYKRLSLSGISNPLPSVHGRSTSNSQNNSNGNCGSGETKRTRISTHQRNLSLDFR